MDRSDAIVQGGAQQQRLAEPRIARPSPDLAIALATLRRGTRFLGAGLRTATPDEGATAIDGVGRARVIGNGLREVDRFLSLLIDAVASHLHAIDRSALHRLGNTPRKLAMLRTAMALGSPDDAALRAIGRTRACLFHTGGIVRACGRGSAPTGGWMRPEPDPAGIAMIAIPIAIGSAIVVTPDDLRRVCDFYDRIADDLLAALVECSGPIDYSRTSAYIETAHVACDGI